MKITIKENKEIIWWYDEYIRSMPAWEYLIILKPYIESRSIQQNCLYWSWITIVASETWNSKEAIHELMKMKFLSKRKRVKISGKTKYVNIMGSTKKLSVKRFTEYLDNVFLFFSENGIVLPTMEQSDIDSLIATYWHM